MFLSVKPNPKTMQKNYLLTLGLFLLSISACTKNEDNSHSNHSISIAGIAGTYKLAATTLTNGGITVNSYDLLDDCEKDNLIRLNPDLSANFIDAGNVCNPPDVGNGNWHLSGDSLFLDSEGVKIKSFDGKTLVLTGYVNDSGIIDSTTVGMTTLVKE